MTIRGLIDTLEDVAKEHGDYHLVAVEGDSKYAPPLPRWIIANIGGDYMDCLLLEQDHEGSI